MFLHCLAAAAQEGTLPFIPDAHHGTGSGPREVLRGRDGAEKQGMFPIPMGATAWKMHLFQSWQGKDEGIELLHRKA